MINTRINQRVVVTLPRKLVEVLNKYMNDNGYSSVSVAVGFILRDYLCSMQGYELT